MLRWYLLLILMVSWATLSKNAFEARPTLPGNVLIDYEANAILVGIASLAVEIGDHSCFRVRYPFSLPCGLADSYNIEVDSVQFVLELVKPIIWGECAGVVRAYFQFHWQPVQTQRFLAPSVPLSCFPLPWVVTLELLGIEGRWFHLSVMVVFQGVYRTRHAWRCGLARDNRGSSALSRSTTLQRQVAMGRPCRPVAFYSDPWRPGIWAAVGIWITHPLAYKFRMLPLAPLRLTCN